MIEFNVRFGEPEAQVVLPMIETDLAPVLHAAALGDLRAETWRVTSDPHVGVVMASGGYPGTYATGCPIERAGRRRGSSRAVVVFHAGSAEHEGRFVTSGGRVLTVVGHGVTFGEAIDRAYHAVSCISFSGQHVRTDIGQKALLAIAAGGGS